MPCIVQSLTICLRVLRALLIKCSEDGLKIFKKKNIYIKKCFLTLAELFQLLYK